MTNLDEEESVPDAETSIFPPHIVKATDPSQHTWFIPLILGEEEASVKDSIMSRLPATKQNMGGEASGFGG